MPIDYISMNFEFKEKEKYSCLEHKLDTTTEALPTVVVTGEDNSTGSLRNGIGNEALHSSRPMKSV